MLFDKPRLFSDPFPSAAMLGARGGRSYLYVRARGCDEPKLVDIASEDISSFVQAHQTVDIDEEFARLQALAEASDTPAFRGKAAGSSTISQPRNDAVVAFSALGKIRRMTEQLFPGAVTFEYASDPEDPSHEYIVFDVFAEGQFKDYVEREFQWHDEVEKIAPGILSQLRLCVHPKS